MKSYYDFMSPPIRAFTSVHPEMVDFGSGQGPSVFCSRRHSALFRGLQKSENAALG